MHLRDSLGAQNDFQKQDRSADICHCHSHDSCFSSQQRGLVWAEGADLSNSKGIIVVLKMGKTCQVMAAVWTWGGKVPEMFCLRYRNQGCGSSGLLRLSLRAFYLIKDAGPEQCRIFTILWYSLAITFYFNTTSQLSFSQTMWEKILQSFQNLILLKVKGYRFCFGQLAELDGVVLGRDKA